MKIKYVGLKDEETAFSPETGITWYPGSSHEIATAVAKRMLAHPDVFAEDTGVEVERPVVTLTPTSLQNQNPPDGNPPEFVMGTTDGPLVLDAMERDDLVELAKSVNVTHHVNLGAAKLRALLVEKHPHKAS